MKFDHLSIWTNQLEAMKDFYVRYFEGIAEPKFTNNAYDFASYFIRLNGGARLEIMQMPNIPPNQNDVIGAQHLGLIHFAFAVDSREAVDNLTEIIRQAGFTIIAEATEYPDGYYETVVGDPDNNRVEISYYFGKN